jgi:hypothetical protein
MPTDPEMPALRKGFAMNDEDKKDLEDIESDCDGKRGSGQGIAVEDVDWLIARLKVEAQENERLQRHRKWLIANGRYWLSRKCWWSKMATELDEALADRRLVRVELEKRIEAAEATCQSLREQSSRWEAQALEAGVRIAELEVKLKEYERFVMSIARAYGEGSISNTSKPQAGGKEER